MPTHIAQVVLVLVHRGKVTVRKHLSLYYTGLMVVTHRRSLSMRIQGVQVPRETASLVLDMRMSRRLQILRYDFLEIRVGSSQNVSTDCNHKKTLPSSG